MKLVALGANLPGAHGSPQDTLRAAVIALAGRGLCVAAASRIWRTAPVPFDEAQPWYYNGVVGVETDMPPHDLLKTLLSIEQDFGRVRTVRNAPRVLDLDLIAYDDAVIMDGPDLIVPHPRMQERAFVLMPMADILGQWYHPQSGCALKDLIASIPADQQAEPMTEALL